ncbi:MAG: cell division protein SepF [Lachnospiraceae bacterium]|nr:cell division protein SepF [Lachnospiraceae bacterium]
MGVFDKLLDQLHFRDEDYDEDYEDDDDVVETRHRFREQMEEEQVKPQRSKITPIASGSSRRSNRSNGFSSNLGVCVVKPKTVDDVQVVVDTLLDNKTAVVNLEGVASDIAQRVTDITFGAMYAIDGHFQYISKNIFIVTPRSVDVSGDFTESTDRVYSDNAYAELFGIAR